MGGHQGFWEMTPQREQAAEMVASGEMVLAEVAAEVGVAVRTLNEWKRRPEFRARVEEIREEIRREVSEAGIARWEVRVRELVERHERLRQIVRERAEHPDYQDVPGGKTGLLVKREKPKDKNGATIVEYEVDKDLCEMFLRHEQQAARELGQWVDRQAVELQDDRAVEDVILGKLARMAKQRTAAVDVEADAPPALPGPNFFDKPGQ